MYNNGHSLQCTKFCLIYENNLVSDGKLGNFYKYINHKLNGSSGIGPLRNSSGEIEYSSQV